MDTLKTKYALSEYSATSPEENIIKNLLRIVASWAQLLVASKYMVYKLLPSNTTKFLAATLLAVVIWKGVTSYQNSNDTYFVGDESSLLGFSLAPAAPRTLKDEAVRAYVQRYGKVAVEEMNQYGIPASISMAQAIVESRCGESTLAEKNNNHFGIKCFSNNCPKGHCSNFTDDSHKDFFRKYKSPWESWREHSKFLSNGRYAELKTLGNDYERWAKGLQKTGYATDDTYASKLIGVIEQYSLNELDK